MYYINLFFVYSILGFVFETILSQFWSGVFNSGILFGPWTPVYGIGVMGEERRIVADDSASIRLSFFAFIRRREAFRYA